MNDIMGKPKWEKTKRKRKWGKKDFISLKTDYNMSQLDIFRIDEILKRCDEFSILCGSGKFGYLGEYYWALRAFYRYIRPIINRAVTEMYDKFFREMFKLLYDDRKLIMTTFLKMEMLHNALLDQRQMSGLGLAARTHRIPAGLKPEYGGIPDYD